jgi:hypothetical protein
VGAVLCLVGAATIAGTSSGSGRWVWFWVCIGLAVLCMGTAVWMFTQPRRQVRQAKRETARNKAARAERMRHLPPVVVDMLIAQAKARGEEQEGNDSPGRSDS